MTYRLPPEEIVQLVDAKGCLGLACVILPLSLRNFYLYLCVLFSCLGLASPCFALFDLSLLAFFRVLPCLSFVVVFVDVFVGVFVIALSCLSVLISSVLCSFVFDLCYILLFCLLFFAFPTAIYTPFHAYFSWFALSCFVFC
jgi:hypothetical protein